MLLQIMVLTSSQDTWHTDQLAFTEEELQSLATMLSGISYCEHSLQGA